MKSVQKLIVFAIAALSGVSAPAQTPAFDLSLGTYSSYQFRGRELYSGLSIQPSASASYELKDDQQVSANLWAHLPGSGEREGREFVESDLTLSWDKQLGPVIISVGHIGYLYSNTDAPLSNTAELFGAVYFDTVLHPRFTIFHDYSEFDMQYYDASFNEPMSTEVAGYQIQFTPYVAAGWASSAAKSIYQRNGIEQITYGILADLEFSEISVVPNFAYTRGIDRLASDTFWCGVTISGWPW